jgi:hypothetical protein
MERPPVRAWNRRDKAVALFYNPFGSWCHFFASSSALLQLERVSHDKKQDSSPDGASLAFGLCAEGV